MSIYTQTNMSSHVSTCQRLHHTSTPIESIVYIPTCTLLYVPFVSSDYLSTYQSTVCLLLACLPTYWRTPPGILLSTYPSTTSLVDADTSNLTAYSACVVSGLLIYLHARFPIYPFPSILPTDQPTDLPNILSQDTTNNFLFGLSAYPCVKVFTIMHSNAIIIYFWSPSLSNEHTFYLFACLSASVLTY